MSRYYDRQGNEVSTFEMAAMYGQGNEARRVDRTGVHDASVSTVHLVIDHSHGDGPPLIFETMIFGGEHDGEGWRYSTEAQARAGHDAVVAWLRGKGPEPEQP